jgi:hypothetical protein
MIDGIKIEIALTTAQHEWLMDLIQQGVAADIDVYFEEGKFFADIANPHSRMVRQIEPEIARPKN